jgi:hypothetical protein
MIVANIKSAKDLQAKKDLQKQLIDLEVSNEAESQKRFQERGIREKEGKKLVEQYRTPAEIQKDKVVIEKKALDYLLELGFPYNEAGQLVNWLSTSNRLADFTTSFKLIKKDIQEGYDKTVVDSEFLKNYLDNFFDDLDSNLGKKFSKDIGKNVDTGLDNIYGPDPFKNLPDSGLISGRTRPKFSLKEGIVESAEQTSSLSPAEYSPQTPTSVDIMFGSTGSLDLDSQYEASSIIGLLQQLEAYLNGLGNNLNAIEYKYKTQQILHLFKILDTMLPPPSVQKDVIQFLSQNERVRVVKNITRAINKLTSIDNVVLKQIQSVLTNSIEQLKRGDDNIALSNLDRIFNVSSRQLSGLVNKEKVDTVIKSYGDYLKVIETKSVDYQRRLDDFNEQMRKIEEEISREIAVDTLLQTPNKEGEYFLDQSRKEVIDEEERRKAVEKIQALVRARKERELTKSKAKTQINKIVSETPNEIIDSIIDDIYGDAPLPPDTSKNILLQEYVEEAKLVELPEEEEINPDEELRLQVNKSVNNFVEELGETVKGNYAEKIAEKNKVLNDVLKQLGEPNPSALPFDLKIEKLKLIQFNRLKAMQPLDRVGRKLIRPKKYPAMKTGLGVSAFEKKNPTSSGIEKLKKHFKGDEQLLKKVLKALQDDSSSEEEEARELSRHIKATKGTDTKIEKLVGKGYDSSNSGFNKNNFATAFSKGNIEANFKNLVGGSGAIPLAVGVVKGGLGREPSVPSFKATRIPVSKVGKGVKLENQENPTYRQFGKYVLHIPHLVNNNTANFKYPSLGSIPSIKPLSVSDDYKDLILDVLQTGKLNKKEFERLPQSEIKHFERVALGAGLVEQLGLKLGNTEEDKADSKRFELLRGEYLAGNNNQALIKELRLLITKFINNGRIHKNEGLNLLLELSTL